MEPLLIPWDMRIRVYIKGIYYLWKAQASLAGLADGYYLVKCESSDQPCLLSLEDWEIHVTGDNVGYIAKTFKTSLLADNEVIIDTEWAVEMLNKNM